MAKILVAEDVETTREAITVVLESAGHEVVAVADGEAAQAELAKGGFDAAVLDIWMPRRSGLDVLKTSRKSDKLLPIILISGGGPGASLEQATAIADLYKASAVIYKPFQDEELLETLDRLMSL